MKIKDLQENLLVIVSENNASNIIGGTSEMSEGCKEHYEKQDEWNKNVLFGTAMGIVSAPAAAPWIAVTGALFWDTSICAE